MNESARVFLKGRENPKHFERAMCSCGSTTDLQVHKYTDEITCLDCVNNRLNEMAALEEYKTGSLNELQTERAE